MGSSKSRLRSKDRNQPPISSSAPTTIDLISSEPFTVSNDNNVNTFAISSSTAISVTPARAKWLDDKEKCACLVYGYFRTTQRSLTQIIPEGLIPICLSYFFLPWHACLAVGQQIDASDPWGKWYAAKIRMHKAANKPMTAQMSAKLRKSQRSELAQFEHLEAIFVHFEGWEEKWNDWIFIEPDSSICTCVCQCVTGKKQHRLAPHGTQSKLKAYASAGLRGKPMVHGCVGLGNINDFDFMNCILQCMAHTRRLSQYLGCGEYKQHINKDNPLAMNGELVTALAVFMADYHGDEYIAISPKKMKEMVSNSALRFFDRRVRSEYAMNFLVFLLNALHEEVNVVKNKPTTEAVEADGRADDVVADEAWKVYQQRNQSVIVDLFAAQQKSCIVCPDCSQSSITFGTYMHLSIPTVGEEVKTFIVDMFHRRTSERVNKPIRHVFHLSRDKTVAELAQMVADVYDTSAQCVIFCEHWDMKVTKQYDESSVVGEISNREAMACYILNDWTEEATSPKQPDESVAVQLAKLCHSAPLDENGRFTSSSTANPLFGIPFVICFLNTHTRRELYCIVYRRLYAWVGPDVLSPPPVTVNETEAEWDAIWQHLPFKLRLLPNKQHSFQSVGSTADVIPIDDDVFENMIISNDMNEIHIVVEWKQAAFDAVRNVVNKVVVDAEYSKWKKQKAHGQQEWSKICTLYDCLDAYVMEQQLGHSELLWYCRHCKNLPKRVTRKLDWWSFPEILIIHLRRAPKLRHEDEAETVNLDLVECPVRGLDVARYALNQAQNGTNDSLLYDLYAVSAYDGSGKKGKHLCYALNEANDQWYCFDDLRISQVDESDVISPTSSVLFYRKRF